MNSFYGGKQGQSFEIKEIFRSRVDLEEDTRRDLTNVLVGEFAFISYGKQSADPTGYAESWQKDTDTYKNSWDLTLWEKVYYPGAVNISDSTYWNNQVLIPDGSAEGIKYKLVAALPSEFPDLKAGKATLLKANEKPVITITGTNAEPVLNIAFPGPWDIAAAIGESAPEGGSPSVGMSTDPNNLSTKLFTFTFPKTWSLNANPIISLLPPVDAPSATVSEDLVTNIRTISFSLPGPWNFDVTHEVQPANLPPSVGISDIDADKDGKNDTKRLHFKISKPWDIDVSQSAILPPGASPTVSIDRSSENQGKEIFDFSLPTSEILKEDIPVTTIGPTEAPTANLSKQDPYHPQINLNLPTAWDIEKNPETPVTYLPPSSSPDFFIENDTTKTKKLISMALPKGAMFRTGELELNISPNETKRINFGELVCESGDYYIDQTTGFVYLIENVDKLTKEADFIYLSSMKGPKGDQGTPFRIYKIYASKEEMDADYPTSDEVPPNGFVLINNNDIESEDNAKLYAKGKTQFEFIVDMSGATGIQGPQGIQGLTGAAAGFGEIKVNNHPALESGNDPIVKVTPVEGSPNTAKSFIFDFELPRGDKGEAAGFGEITVQNHPALEPDQEPIVSVTPIAESPNKAKDFKFDFQIPRGYDAGFGEIHTTNNPALPPDASPIVKVTTVPGSPNTAKEFNFDFQIPQGKTGNAAGFGEITVQNHPALEPNQEPIVAVTPVEDSPSEAKDFKFDFQIPRGYDAGFGEIHTTNNPALPPKSKPVVTVTTVPDSPNTAKEFNFDFQIPQGEKGDKGDTGNAAGFGKITTENHPALEPDQPPVVSVEIDSTSPNEAKNFTFDFQIPRGYDAGFGKITTKNHPALSPESDPIVTVTPVEGSPNTAKEFNFDFQIPQGKKGDTGDAAGFGTPTVSAVRTLPPEEKAKVSVNASGDDTAKIFDFTFDIPQGKGLNILGHYNNFSDLSTVIDPKPGDAYSTGVEKPYHIAIWGIQDETYKWIDIGVLEGAKGDSWRPILAENGDLSWETNNDKTPPPTANIRGPIGPIGPQGISIKTIETQSQEGDLAPNTVTITLDDEPTTVKTFTVLNGSKGSVGPAAGFAQPTIGNVMTLPAESPATANVNATGEDTNKLFTFDFGIPQGTGIQEVKQITTATKSSEDNVIQTTLTNGTTSTFKVKNGEQGERGPAFTYQDFTEDQLKGLTGPQGPVGPTGTGIKSIETQSVVGDEAENIITISLDDNPMTQKTFSVRNGSKGSTGDSGVYVGVQPPTDIKKKVWINPDGLVNEIGAVVWKDYY